jgi:hypothetical protein
MAAIGLSWSPGASFGVDAVASRYSLTAASYSFRCSALLLL